MYSCYDVKGRREQPRIIKFFRDCNHYKQFVSQLDPRKNQLLTRFLQPVDAHSPNTDENIKIRDHVVPPFVIQKRPDSLRSVACSTGMDALLALQVLNLLRSQFAMHRSGKLKELFAEGAVQSMEPRQTLHSFVNFLQPEHVASCQVASSEYTLLTLDRAGQHGTPAA